MGWSERVHPESPQGSGGDDASSNLAFLTKERARLKTMFVAGSINHEGYLDALKNLLPVSARVNRQVRGVGEENKPVGQAGLTAGDRD